MNRQRGVLGNQAADRRRPSDVRREREIGNWGRASEHIGNRWEEIGYQRLMARLEDGRPWPTDDYQPIAIAPLMSDMAVQTVIAATGLPSPDVIVIVGDRGGKCFLQALDFKWDIEFATYEQICAASTDKLMRSDSQPLRDLVSRAGSNDLPEACIDGVLFAPDSGANRRFLASHANNRREYPIAAEEVILEGVDGVLFFSPLPGWEVAVRLAEIDRAGQSLCSLECADRYYRLGAGLLGAASKLHASVFRTDPPAIDAELVIGQFHNRCRTASTEGLLEHAEHAMMQRAQLVERLRRLTRCPYRLKDMEQALARRGVTLPERPAGRPLPVERARWLQVLKRVEVEYKGAIHRTGLRMVEGGLGDADALARLEADAGRFADASRALAAKLIDKALVSPKPASQSASK